MSCCSKCGEHLPAVHSNDHCLQRQVDSKQGHLDFAYTLWAYLPEQLRKETVMLGEHLLDEASPRARAQVEAQLARSGQVRP